MFHQHPKFLTSIREEESSVFNCTDGENVPGRLTVGSASREDIVCSIVTVHRQYTDTRNSNMSTNGNLWQGAGCRSSLDGKSHLQPEVLATKARDVGNLRLMAARRDNYGDNGCMTACPADSSRDCERGAIAETEHESWACIFPRPVSAASPECNAAEDRHETNNYDSDSDTALFHSSSEDLDSTTMDVDEKRSHGSCAALHELIAAKLLACDIGSDLLTQISHEIANQNDGTPTRIPVRLQPYDECAYQHSSTSLVSHTEGPRPNLSTSCPSFGASNVLQMKSTETGMETSPGDFGHSNTGMALGSCDIGHHSDSPFHRVPYEEFMQSTDSMMSSIEMVDISDLSGC